MTAEATPAPAELAAELYGMLRTGVTTERLRGCPALLALHVVRAKSASELSDDLAVAAYTLIAEAASRVDGDRNGPAALLLGLATGSRNSLLKDRRRRAAGALHISAEHLRKEREPLLVEAVADELHAADSAYRLRHRHRSEPDRSPERSGLRIDWLAQHRSYRRIWTPLNAMRSDCFVLQRYQAAQEEDQPAIADRLVNITWQWTRFLRELDNFVTEQGGLWLLADTESEIAAADAIYRAQLHVPLGETDCSWLRTLLAETPHHELDGFGDRLIEAGERRRELMSVWLDWIGSCNGNLAHEEPGCAFHAWDNAARDFIRLIDEDWYRVADWYRAYEGDISGLDVRKLWETN